MSRPRGAWFAPLLAGARSRDRLIAALGGTFGIGLTGWLASFHVAPGVLLFLAAPLGASAVLLFAVPASPMSAPWPVIGGAMVSTASGSAIVHLLGATPLAAGLSVGLAIAAMSALRCLHPPGGGYALMPVVAGASAPAASLGFVLAPVGLGALLLVLSGLAFHRFVSGHGYPHRAPKPPSDAFTSEDIDAALADLGETFDVAREDLDALLEAAERHARARRR